MSMRMRPRNVTRNTGARTCGRKENCRRLRCIEPGYQAKDNRSETEHSEAGFGNVDIIAIHDLRGHYRTSWTHLVKQRTTLKRYCFFDELRVHFPFARILSYQWKGDVEEAASVLISELIEDRASEKCRNVPIFFLGHGFGGIIAKRVFLATLSLQDPQIRLHEAIKGFIFLGTRHHGQFQGWTHEDWARKLEATSDTSQRSKKDPIRQSQLTDAISVTYVTNEEFRRVGGEMLAAVSCFETPNRMNRNEAIISQEDAIIIGSSAENLTIHRQHKMLNKPMHAGQLNDDGIIPSIFGLIARVLHPPIVNLPESTVDHEDEATLPVAPRLRILSLDGGGVRGLWAIVILESLFEEIRKIDQPSNPDALKPCDYFDIIGGTTTGGLLAIMLGRLRMDIASCREFYISIVKQSFRYEVRYSLKAYADAWSPFKWFVDAWLPLKRYVDAWLGVPWFTSEPLERALKDLVSSRLSMKEQRSLKKNSTSAENAPLRSFREGSTKTFILAIVKDSIEPSRLRTYCSASDPGYSTQDFTILEACRATMAARLYFPLMTINSRDYFDEGMNSNNPILETIDEANLEYSDGKFRPSCAAVVSLGTGKGTSCGSVENIWTVFKRLLHRDTEMKLLSVQRRRWFAQYRYCRFICHRSHSKIGPRIHKLKCRKCGYSGVCKKVGKE